MSSKNHLQTQKLLTKTRLKKLLTKNPPENENAIYLNHKSLAVTSRTLNVNFISYGHRKREEKHKSSHEHNPLTPSEINNIKFE